MDFACKKCGSDRDLSYAITNNDSHSKQSVNVHCSSCLTTIELGDIIPKRPVDINNIQNIVVEPGGLQAMSKLVANKHDLTLGALVMIEAVGSGSTFAAVAEKYGVTDTETRKYQFIADTIKNANQRAQLAVFNVYPLSREELIEKGLPLNKGRYPRWISLTKYGRTILQDIYSSLNGSFK